MMISKKLNQNVENSDNASEKSYNSNTTNASLISNRAVLPYHEDNDSNPKDKLRFKTNNKYLDKLVNGYKSRIIPNALRMETTLVKYMQKHPIVFIVSNSKIEANELGTFISTKLDNSKVFDKMPNSNDSDYMIFVPDRSSFFFGLYHDNLTAMNFNKTPKGIIVILSFDNLYKMDKVFVAMSLLEAYNFPYIKFSLHENPHCKIELKLKEAEPLTRLIHSDDNAIHINSPEEFDRKIKYTLLNPENKNNCLSFNLYCSNKDNQKEIDYLKRKERCESVIDFYEKITDSDSNELGFNGKELVIS